MESKSENKFLVVAAVYVVIAVSCLCVGYMAGINHAPGPETDNPGPIDVFANLTINIINPGGTLMDGDVWVYDNLGRELYYCATDIHHSGAPNYIYVAWDDVTEYDGTTFTIIVRTATRHVEPVIETKEVGWVCMLGKEDTVIITLGGS